MRVSPRTPMPAERPRARAAEPRPRQPPARAKSEPHGGAGRVTVQPGDSLASIARRVLGDVNRWRDLYDANRDQLSDPNRIYAGMPLRLPGQQAPGDTLPLSAAAIADALGAPLENVEAHWPGIAKALEAVGMTAKNQVIGILATIAVETGSFAPIPEYADGWAYEGRSDLGNVHPGDGPRYKGRGFIQITGRANYTDYGHKLGIDLAAHPERALEADVAAQILVRYFQDRGVDQAAAQGDWGEVRRLVNGGYNGWDHFIGAVNSLQEVWP